MVSCTNIVLEKIRARITFGSVSAAGVPSPGSVIFETPDIKSFSVNRSRTALAATFTATIQVPSNTVIPVDQDIVIEAGVEGDLKRLFTGRVLSATVNPSFEDASSFTLNLSGADRLQELEGKTISRRQRARGFSTFAAITGVSARRPQRGISHEKRESSGGGKTRIVNPDTNIREHSQLVRTDRIAWDPFKQKKDPESLEGRDDTSQTPQVSIKPKSVALSPGVSVRFSIENTQYAEGDTWSVSDPSIGTIVDQRDGTAVYTQLALGENTITFAKAGTAETSTETGTATAVGIPIHDHSSLGQGGPAFGVFGSD